MLYLECSVKIPTLNENQTEGQGYENKPWDRWRCAGRVPLMHRSLSAVSWYPSFTRGTTAETNTGEKSIESRSKSTWTKACSLPYNQFDYRYTAERFPLSTVHPILLRPQRYNDHGTTQFEYSTPTQQHHSSNCLSVTELTMHYTCIQSNARVTTHSPAVVLSEQAAEPRPGSQSC